MCRPSQDVSEADVLRYALDGHLKLSLNFVNRAAAIECKIIPIEEASYIPLDILVNFEITDHHKIEIKKVLRDMQLNATQALTLTGKQIELLGDYELEMIGNAHIEIENKYQSLTGGPEITELGMEGIFVKSDNDIIYKIHERDDDIKETANLTEILEAVKNIRKNNEINPVDDNKQREQYEKMMKTLVNSKDISNFGNDSKNYYPVLSVPNDCAIVVRTDAIEEFVQSINDESSSTNKPLTPKERNTLFVIIAALCNRCNINTNDRAVAKQIAHFTEVIGAPVTDDTIRNILTKMSDAVDIRKIK